MQTGLLSLLEDIAAHAKQQLTSGVGALIVGPGAGAILTIIQQLADREAYRVDLNAVIFKYIAETEKNLERAFKAAEQRDAILFFDEADCLFGKRSEVKDSHDRYVNSEFGYLLRRIESFPGLVVLASSTRVPPDPTLRQRLRYLVDLADIEAIQSGVASENIKAIGALYFAAMLDELMIFQVVDRLVALLALGQLPLGCGNAAALLRSGWQEAQLRLSDKDRRNIYARTLGMPGGDVSVSANSQFNDLWIRFIAAIASGGAHGSTVGAGHDLAVNLTLHGYGVANFAAEALQQQIRYLGTILSDPEIRSAFGARDMWQVVEQVATRYLGGTADVARYVTMAVSSSTIFDWLAKHAALLLEYETCRSDPELIDAGNRWMNASYRECSGAALLSGAGEKSVLNSGVGGSQSMREILEAHGLQALHD